MKRLIVPIIIIITLLCYFLPQKAVASHCDIQNLTITANPSVTPYTPTTEFTFSGNLTCNDTRIFLRVHHDDDEIDEDYLTKTINTTNKAFTHNLIVNRTGMNNIYFADSEGVIENISFANNSSIKPEAKDIDGISMMSISIGNAPGPDGEPGNFKPYECGDKVQADTPTCPQEEGVSCCPSNCIVQQKSTDSSDYYCGDPPDEEEEQIPRSTPAPPPCGDGKGELDSDGKCPSLTTAIGSIKTEPGDFITNLLRILLSISGGIALIIIIYAGYRFMISRGDPEAIGHAKELMTSAIIGLLFLIFSLVILEVIGVDILQLPGFSN
jgi:hypothetical protein